MEVGDLVKLKSSGGLGVITEIWTPTGAFIPTAYVYLLSSRDEAHSHLDDLELVK